MLSLTNDKFFSSLDPDQFVVKHSFQLNKRVSECVKALHVLEEINLGQLQFDNVAVGKDMEWSQFKVCGTVSIMKARVNYIFLLKNF